MFPSTDGRRPRWPRLRERMVHGGLVSAASISILIVTLVFLFLLRESIPFLQSPGPRELLGRRWNPVSFQTPAYGILPLIAGTVQVTLLAALIAIPLGVCSAVYIAEIAHRAEREVLKPFVELLAGIPSVVLGFFGLVFLAPVVKWVFQLQSGLTALTGAILLALMAAPTIISVSEDAIRSVPQSYKEASLALGASRMRTTWLVVVPAAIPGITAAIILGIGRVIGETMAVMMVTGNAPQLTLSPFEPVRTMTATIAAEMGEVVFGSTHYNALFFIGVLLLVATFVLNIAAQHVLKRYHNRT